MDWNLAIERNREALKRIVAMLAAMAGLASAASSTSPLWGGRRSPDRHARPSRIRRSCAGPAAPGS